jgi:hypothetical protein
MQVQSEKDLRNERVRFWVQVILLGPLPLVAVVELSRADLFPRELLAPFIFPFIGGLLGLTVGLSTRSLSRVLLGLNGGALMGYAFGKVLVLLDPSRYFLFEFLLAAVMLGVLSGVLHLGYARPGHRFGLGFGLGFVKGFLAMFAAISVLYPMGVLILILNIRGSGEHLMIFISLATASTLCTAILSTRETRAGDRQY